MPHVKDPIDPKPFVQWFDATRDLMARSCDNPTERLFWRLGWNEAAHRKLTRWRDGETKSASRMEIEEALWRAGVFFDDVYDPAKRDEWELEPFVPLFGKEPA